MSQKVESLVVCGWIENSNYNNGQYRRTTTAGIHQRIQTGSIASPKETTPDGSTALFQCAEAPGRLKILGFSFSYYDIDQMTMSLITMMGQCVEVSQIVTLLVYCRHSVCLA